MLRTSTGHRAALWAIQNAITQVPIDRRSDEHIGFACRAPLSATHVGARASLGFGRVHPAEQSSSTAAARVAAALPRFTVADGLKVVVPTVTSSWEAVEPRRSGCA